MLTYCKIKPVCNQVQLYPECVQEDLVKWMVANEIQPVAYSPVGRLPSATTTHHTGSESANNAYVLELAKKYEKSACQIILAWGLMRGYCVIPKAASKGHQEENMAALDIKLTAEEHAEIIKVLDKGRLIFFDFPQYGVNNIFA